MTAIARQARNGVSEQHKPRYGQVRVPLADLRAAPCHEAELHTQAFLATPLTRGDTATDAAGVPWQQVCLPDYEGWMRAAEVRTTDGPAAPTRQVCVAARSAGLRVIDDSGTAGETEITVYMGTLLALAEDAAASGMEGWVIVTLPDGQDALADPGTLVPVDPDYHGQAAAVIESACALLGTLYLWGGMSQEGVDCSGLAQVAYRVHGYGLPRDADQQFEQVGPAVVRHAWQPGDLLFYGDAPDTATHVLLYLGDERVIHASGAAEHVVIQSMNPAHADYHQRTDQYLGARRVIGHQLEGGTRVFK